MALHFRCEYIRCGKKNCHTCPHGPYWYSYERINKRLHKKYVGKQAPVFANNNCHMDRRDEIFSRSTASVALAEIILGVGKHPTEKDARAAFRRLTKKHHPHRGGEDREFRLVSAAWSYLSKLNGW